MIINSLQTSEGLTSGEAMSRLAEECDTQSMTGLYALEQELAQEGEDKGEGCEESRAALNVISEAIMTHAVTEVAIVPALPVSHELHQLDAPCGLRLPIAS